MEDQPTDKKTEILMIENSNLKTKKKSFVSEVDPHMMKRKIQKEKYIWFGVYDELLRNKNIIKFISKCKDTTLPIECAAIHLEKYKMGFSKNKSFITFNSVANIMSQPRLRTSLFYLSCSYPILLSRFHMF